MNIKVIREKVRRNLLNESRIPFNLPVPEDVQIITKLFEDYGYKLYVVGGAVRDALSNITPKDWDLATDARPDKIIEILKTSPIVNTLKLVGERFGIIMAVTDSDEYEIATFREDEGNQDAGETEVKFSTIEKDVKRRDLTINALFYDLSTKEIVDLVGGVEDIKNKRIVTVGRAEDRFAEDSLRKLRAIRFAARVGSELDPTVDNALKNDASISKLVAAEPIMQEFIKGIKQAKSAKHYFTLLEKYGMFKYIFPPSYGINLNGFSNSNDLVIVLAVLLQNNDPSEIVKKLSSGEESLSYSGDIAMRIQYLLSLKDLTIDNVYGFKKSQRVEGERIIAFAKELNWDSNLYSKFVDFKLSVTGDQVQQELGIAPGPEMGKAIKKLEADNFKELL